MKHVISQLSCTQGLKFCYNRDQEGGRRLLDSEPMPQCPQCGTECVEGSVECPDCRQALQPGLASEQVPHSKGSGVKLVRLRTFNGPTAQLDANLARNILETQGILCVLPGEASAEMLPGVDPVQLLVRREDAEEAAEILQSYLESPHSTGPKPEE